MDDDNSKDVPEPAARQPIPPSVEPGTVKNTSLIDPAVSSENTDSLPTDMELTSDMLPHEESNTRDEMAFATTVPQALEAANELNEPSRAISVETTGQDMHYTVSEVMTDDAARSTAPPEDRDIDIVSIANDYDGEPMPYVIEEPFTEGRLTEVGLLIPGENVTLNLLQEPPDREVGEESNINMTMDPEIRSVGDNEPNSPVPETILTIALSDTLEGELTSSEDINWSNEIAPGDEAPLVATDKNNQFTEGGQSEDISAHGKEHEVHDAFPMPVSADPTVPDPIDLLAVSKVHSSPPILPLSGHLLDSAAVVPDLVGGAPTVVDMMSRQESFSSATASGLFTPQTEAVIVSETPGTQSINPADNIQLTNSVDTGPSTTPILDTSVPSEMTMDRMEAISMDILPEESDDMWISSPQPPRIASSSNLAETEDDPFKLMGTDSKVAPGPIDNGSSSGDSKAEEQPSDSLSPGDDQ